MSPLTPLPAGKSRFSDDDDDEGDLDDQEDEILLSPARKNDDVEGILTSRAQSPCVGMKRTAEDEPLLAKFLAQEVGGDER